MLASVRPPEHRVLLGPFLFGARRRGLEGKGGDHISSLGHVGDISSPRGWGWEAQGRGSSATEWKE